ncbi:MAG: sigma-54-dependent Fis family transcriptional regulator [Desulfamplus sp.]|nr:sigma-54-dependent Fis family transcriptional regulator [Desulfamplus sp.]MBF0388862.1 sigma-54-dependent Fis family transcriptional regulator [Desulfamplus sp.]
MKEGACILIVDDDPNILEVLDARLTASGFNVLKACDAQIAMQILEQEQKGVDLLISDMKMPVVSGMDLFLEVQKSLPELPVIFLTAYGTIPDAVEAIKHGAVDYISKPFDGRELIKKIGKILEAKEQNSQILAHQSNQSHQLHQLDQHPTQTNFGKIDSAKLVQPDGYIIFEDEFYWDKTPAMQELYSMIKRVAATDVNVMILGESGVGKEWIARAIYRNSSRRDQPYVVVDCGSTPAGILESELFGHLKGSFTSAVKDKKGLIETADKGTLFLDEIGNISHDMQCRLLRFLEDKSIRQVGSVHEKIVDCRIISATNADLSRDIEAGTFRQDLYYRLKVVTLTVPPLRDRKEEIADFAKFFVDRYTKSHNLSPVTFADATIELMDSHDWPGNIRELRNALEAGIVLCKNNIMQPFDLQLGNNQKSKRNIKSDPTRNSSSDSRDSQSFNENDSQLGFSIEDSEKHTIIRALKESKGVQKKAAELLDISRRAINYKIKKYDIQPRDYK